MLRLRVKQAMADAVAIGRVWRYRAGAYAPSGLVVPSGERPAEQSRFDAAVAAAEGELEKLAAANEIFAAHLELAADPMLMENVAEKIAEGMTAADAVHAASGELAALFAQIDDEYLRARADDVRDVCRRILRQLVPSETDPFAAIPDGSILAADELAAEVDFFSIGTNDLTQYVLAVDRGNRRIAAMYDTLHPAVVRAMRLTVDAAHRHGCEVGICGEFAGCAAHAELLVGLGFDELSVAPPSVPAVKERIRGLETPQAELTARRAVEAATASEVHELIGVG